MKYQIARRQMVENHVIGAGISDERVIQAMNKVPRHLFVQEAFSGQAYTDKALPIGAGQTISHPTTVARMSEALQLSGKERVLEIGTGSGYQAAVLAELTRVVYTVERISVLLDRARQLLLDLQCFNIIFREDDGSRGWESEGPFDRIIVTAGAPAVPPSLNKQLTPGGRLIVPVTSSDGRDDGVLKCIDYVDGELKETVLSACRFVPLVGKEGWEERVKETL